MENLDFITTPQYTKEDVKRAQARLLEMAKLVCRTLEENHFDYFIVSGTLLGAIRHGGFIPWDDDFDLFLFDDTYDAAVECVRKVLPSDMLMHDKSTDPIYWPAWAKVRDLNTETVNVLFKDDNAYKYSGLNLDLYRCKKVPRDFMEIWRKKEHIEFLVRKHDSKMLTDEEFFKTFVQWNQEFCDFMHEYNAKPVHDDNDCVFSHYSRLKQWEVSDMFPLKWYDFEDTRFLGPNNPDPILRLLYGPNYMTVPEYKDRKPHYDYIKWLDHPTR